MQSPAPLPRTVEADAFVPGASRDCRRPCDPGPSAKRREDRGSLISPGPSSLLAERRATSTVAGTCVSVSSSTIGMVKSIRYPLWVKPDASTSFSPSSVNICDALPRSYRSHAVNEAGGSLRRFCSVHGRSADLFFPRSPLRSRSHLRSRSSRPSQEAS